MNQREIQPKSEVLPPSSLTFEEFANQPEYIDVNRKLIQKLTLFTRDSLLHIDVGSGTGLVPKLMIEIYHAMKRQRKIIGIDPNPISLEIAKKTTPQSDNVFVEYIKGKGQDIAQLVYGKVPPDGFDSASIHDALHEIEGEDEKRSVLIGIRDALKPGGALSFNSAFTTFGMKAENSEVKWGRWKMNALRFLGGQRDKNVEPIKIHTPEQYKEMIESVGLKVIHEDNPVVHLSQKALAAISKYPKFIEGVFGDMIGQENFSLEKKSEALIKALENVQSIPRGWYEIIAQKPLSPA